MSLLIAAGIVLLLPGLAWWLWFHSHDSPSFSLILADIIGISIALTELVALGAYLLGWRISGLWLVLLYALAGLLALAGISFKFIRARNASLPELFPKPGESKRQVFESLAVLVGLGLLLFWRFYQARPLVLPAWVDSVQHVLIVRVILEQGGIPHSLAPYLPVPFYYHYGFHVLAAVFAALSRLQPQQAVLWIGQVLNALVALSVFRFGIALWGDFRRAGLAGLLVGFALQMPAYYLTWGRYTLLTGLVLLPLAMAAALDIFHAGASRERLARLVILTAGVLLAHYFAGLLLGMFIGALGMQALWRDINENRVHTRGEAPGVYPIFRIFPIKGQVVRNSRFLPLLLGSLLGLLLASGWLVHVWGFASGSAEITAVASTEAVGETYFPEYLPYLWHLLGPARNYALLSLAPLGLLVSLSRPRSRTTALWALLMVAFSLPWGLRLGPFRPDHMVIVLFIPAALLISDLLVCLYEQNQSMQLAWVGQLLIGASVIGLLAWGVWDTRSILNPATVFTGPADVKANEWIAQNTAPKARFLINTAFWQGSTYRGVDGGYWIMPLTGRSTLLPPVVYDWGSVSDKLAIDSLAQKTSQLEGCTAEFWQVVAEAKPDYLYVVEGRGNLQPSNLEGCAGLLPVYSEGGVVIYKITK